MTELRALEADAFAVLAASTAVGAITRIRWPEYYFIPDWVLLALLGLVFLAGVKLFITEWPTGAEGDSE